MSDKESTKYPSRYAIGEAVDLVLSKEEDGLRIPAFVRAIIFTNMKVRYTLYLKEIRSSIHNVDSIWVRDSSSDETVNFEDDNYS